MHLLGRAGNQVIFNIYLLKSINSRMMFFILLSSTICTFIHHWYVGYRPKLYWRIYIVRLAGINLFVCAAR